jgi:NADH:ubiquinone oxidoreductase subunit F (NADH-binding)
VNPFTIAPQARASRLLPERAEPDSFDAHIARFGPRPSPESATLIDALKASGLRGRGGAEFPTWIKWRAVRESSLREGGAVVIANAAECEPASLKDQTLLALRPHLVLDGLELALEAVGASRAVIYICRGRGTLRQTIEAALSERRTTRDTTVPIEIVTGPNRYVAGEETAVVARVTGRAAKPSAVPPRPFQSGVSGNPTLVQNVETLAHAAQVARFGPEWFGSVGTRASPGTALLTVTGAVGAPGVLEAGFDETVGAVVERAGGALGEPAALLVGGYFGRWVAAEHVWSVPLDSRLLRIAGAALGTGVIAVLPRGACGTAECDRVLTFLAGESARQCGPCQHGLPAMADLMHSVATGRSRPLPLEQLARWASDVRGRGACRHPDGASLFLASAIDVFGADMRQHVRAGPCRGSEHPPLLPIPETERSWL